MRNADNHMCSDSISRLMCRSSVFTLVLLMALMAGPSSVNAQSRVATSAASFLTLGMGARGSALGHAYTASATGADALLWNPAGAARIPASGHRGSVFFSHADWLIQTDLNAFGVVIPVTGSGVVGFSLGQLDYGRMDIRTVNLPEGTGETFGASDMVIGLTYAQPLTDRFYIGGTTKYISQKIYDMSASTVAFDLGFVLVSDYFGGLRIAASIMNFGGLMQMQGVNGRIFVDIDPTHSGSNSALPAELETGRWDLPLSFKFGTALPVINTEFIDVELLADAHQTNDNDLNLDLGTEMRFTSGPITMDFRAGYKDAALGDQVTSHWAVGGGFGVNISRTRLVADYGYIPFDALGNVSVFDLSILF